MPTLHIEHQIRNFDTWKGAFDRDPADRKGAGVRRYRVMRPVDDPAYVMIDLDFDTIEEAEAFVGVMHKVWQSPQAAPGLLGRPQARIVEVVESKDL
ncbi:hypothetical protein BH23CHL2_BH23CHL2_18040 [soil metagenome]